MLKHMQLSVEVIAVHQPLLLTSLKDTLGPRWAFPSLMADHHSENGFSAIDHLSALVFLSDTEFASMYNSDLAGVELVYNEAFKQKWQADNVRLWQNTL